MSAFWIFPQGQDVKTNEVKKRTSTKSFYLNDSVRYVQPLNDIEAPNDEKRQSNVERNTFRHIH
jgi:hypothetical protein